MKKDLYAIVNFVKWNDEGLYDEKLKKVAETGQMTWSKQWCNGEWNYSNKMVNKTLVKNSDGDNAIICKNLTLYLWECKKCFIKMSETIYLC